MAARRFALPICSVLIALLTALGAPRAIGQTPAQSPTAASVAAWPQLAGDLPLDPSVTLGVLPNGVRYMIQKDASPPGHAALRLVIEAGSMHEQKDQEGLAHFLEHMAFHGSKRVADGDVIKILERLGLRFGADTNASTGPDQTIYKFNLAKNDLESVDTGLMLLREIGDGLTLDPAIMDKERGVVLAELRLREQPLQTFQKALFGAQLGEHPYGRSPGGRPEVIQTAPIERIRAFYDAYYRPERGVVIVVGDVDPKAIESSIKAKFSDWKGRGGPGTDPAPVVDNPTREPIVVETIEGMPTTLLQLRWFEPYHPEAATKADLRRRLIDRLAAAALSARSAGLLEGAGKPAQTLGVITSSRIPGVWNGWALGASGVNDVAKTLRLAVASERQARMYGITQDELDRAVKTERAARTRSLSGPPAPPPELAADIAASASRGDGLFLSPKDGLELFEEQVKAITLSDVNTALGREAAGDAVLIYAGSSPPPGGKDGLRADLTEAMSAAIAPYSAPAVKPWPYTNFGPAGKVAERRELTDLGVTLVRFENGVRLTIKPNDARKNDVVARVRIGRGRIDMPRQAIDASDMGLWAWGNGGLGRLTRPEQLETLRDDFVSAITRQTDDAFVVETCAGGCLTPEKMDLQLQLFAAMLSDPGYRTDDWANMLKASDEADRSSEATASGVAARFVPALTHANDLRWAYNTDAMRRTWKPSDAVAFIKPIVAQSPIEVLVAGDVKPDDVILSVSKTLGALPARKAVREAKGLRDVKFPPATPKPILLSHGGPPSQGLAYVLWPTADVYASPRLHRTRLVLARLLQARATEKVRNADAKSYSPSAAITNERVFPGYGYMGVVADAPPDALDGVIASVEAIARDLGAGEISQDEFDRALGPLVESSKRARQQNAFWVDSLANAQTDPRVSAFLRSEAADYSSLTRADVQAEARRRLTPTTEWKLKIAPGTPAR